MDFILSALPIITPMGALLALGVWIVRQVATGKFIPEDTYLRMIAAKDEQLQITETALKLSQNQVDKLINNGETTVAMLNSITALIDKRAAERSSDE